MLQTSLKSDPLFPFFADKGKGYINRAKRNTACRINRLVFILQSVKLYEVWSRIYDGSFLKGRESKYGTRKECCVLCVVI